MLTEEIKVAVCAMDVALRLLDVAVNVAGVVAKLRGGIPLVEVLLVFTTACVVNSVIAVVAVALPTLTKGKLRGGIPLVNVLLVVATARVVVVVKLVITAVAVVDLLTDKQLIISTLTNPPLLWMALQGSRGAFISMISSLDIFHTQIGN